MKYVFLVFLIVFVLYTAIELVRMSRLIKISKILIEQTSAFSIKPQQFKKRYLIIGDSLGVGVGASSPEKSIAGLISADHPQAEIVNLSKSGSRIYDGLETVRNISQNEKFDVAIIQLGANDITHLSSYNEMRVATNLLLKEVKQFADKTIFLTSGSVGSAPIFHFPLNRFYHARSLNFFKMFSELTQENSVGYIDLSYPASNDPFSKNPGLYYAADSFHITDAGYMLWYQKIKEFL